MLCYNLSLNYNVSLTHIRTLSLKFIEVMANSGPSKLTVAEQICVNNHARLTPIRKAVFELVSKATIPLSAYELLEQLKQNHPNAKPPTIYRALEFLIDQKLVHKLSTINAIIVCDCPGEQHAVLFLICKFCSQAKEIIEPALMLQLGHRIQASGYIEPYPVLEVMGICPDCIEA